MISLGFSFSESFLVVGIDAWFCNKSSTSETYDFASCILSPKSNDSFSNVDVKISPKSDVKDPSPTNGLPSCSFKENVKPPRHLCNKSGKADRIHCKNNFVRTKKCFVCGSKSHLIKDCDVYDTVDNFPSVVSKAASVPAGSRNSSASTSAGRSIPATSGNRSVSIHDGRHIPAGMINKPAPFPTGSSVPTGNKEKLDDFVQVKGVLTKEFQLPDESQVVLRIPRRHDLYTFNLSDIQPEQHINCLLAKASFEESTKWHRRMAHVNFKTINKLAKHGLVDGLPLKLFTNEHNCVACNKENQHQASYKAIFAMRTISEPLQLLHMDLFGLTSIRSVDHKYYSLVVTDDFSRFSWAFFLGTKDEIVYILKDFIALIENQLNKKFKAIRCDNGTEFQNAKLIAFCGEKGIKKDYKAVSTACYVLNRVSITNPHNKTPYELLFGKGKLMTVFLLEDKPNVQGLGQEWYFDLDYLTDSLSYTRFKTNPLAGTYDTNIVAGTPDDDSKSECDEQVILVHSFLSNSFSGPKVHDVSAPIENNLDYTEELARLQRQEHEAHSATAKYGFEFSNDTAAMLHQAKIKTRRNLVLAVGDPTGSIVSTGGVPAGNVPTSGVPAGSVPAGSIPASHVPASSIPASSVPTGSVPASHVPASSIPAGGVLAGSIDSAEFGDPAASEPVHAVFTTDPAATSPLPPGHSLGSSEHTTRFPSPSDLGNHQPTAGIFSSSSYDTDFYADVTNLV
nr:hypothetical protein [Tanacetum cinerariifolium]